MTTMTARIALLAGDGVGPEVIAEARKVLTAAATRLGKQIVFSEHHVGGVAIDRTGNPLPDETLASCRDCEAVLLGAVGGPKWADPAATVRPEQGLLRLRKELGLFANLRPVRVYPELCDAVPVRKELVAGVDLMVVRELTGGIYFGDRGRRPHETGELAFDTMAYSTGEVERITRLAARLAEGRRGRLTSVDKANVLESSRLWRSTVERVVEAEFPGVELEHVLVDAGAMYLIQSPARFDVLVTSNMFGDILTDEASVLAGSMGLLPSASLGDGRLGMYEPIHGSAPDIAGRGVANPIGMILSAAMLCRWSLDWLPAAECIEEAVARVVSDGYRTVDIAAPGGESIGTAAMGDRIAEAVATMELSDRSKDDLPCART